MLRHVGNYRPATLGVAVALTTWLAGCKDATTMPKIAGSNTELEGKTSFVPASETLDEEFARLAGEVPGGFAGFT